MMLYRDMLETFIWNFRLDFDPVGISFISDESEIEGLPLTHRTKNRLSFCQYIAAARSARYALFMSPDKLSCPNARAIFGFRDLDDRKDGRMHEKYMLDPDLSVQVPKDKASLEKGSCSGAYIAPLDMFDRADVEPDLVFFMVIPYQAYHIITDYMGAVKKTNLSFLATPNSAVCSGGVYALKNNTANMTTMCAGSKTSGKNEMNYMNLFIPGTHIGKTVKQMKMRLEKLGGPSLLGRGGQPWPGLDVCGGCPMVKFEKVQEEGA